MGADFLFSVQVLHSAVHRNRLKCRRFASQANLLFIFRRLKTLLGQCAIVYRSRETLEAARNVAVLRTSSGVIR